MRLTKHFTSFSMFGVKFDTEISRNIFNLESVSRKLFLLLTPWRLGGFGNFRKKNSSFWLPYQHPSLVSNENFSETLWPSGWALGQVT